MMVNGSGRCLHLCTEQSQNFLGDGKTLGRQGQSSRQDWTIFSTQGCFSALQHSIQKVKAQFHQIAYVSSAPRILEEAPLPDAIYKATIQPNQIPVAPWLPLLTAATTTAQTRIHGSIALAPTRCAFRWNCFFARFPTTTVLYFVHSFQNLPVFLSSSKSSSCASDTDILFLKS